MDFRRPGLITRLAMPLRGMGQRFVLGFLLIATFGIMIIGNNGAMFVERLRMSVTDVAAPILEIIVQPITAVNRGIAHVRGLSELLSENITLRREVRRLRAWQGVAHKLAAENDAFRKMINYQGPKRHALVSAQVIADGRGPFVKSVLVNAGTRQSVAKGQAVTTPGGLVGRVREAGRRAARVLILTDLNSRIPVMIEDNRTRAILSGDNTARPRLIFLPEATTVAVGQRIVTSGHGGELPPGLPVGRVSSINNGIIRVQPLVNLDRLEYLQIVDFKTLQAPGTGIGHPGVKEQAETK